MHAGFVDRAIKDLLTGGYVEKVLEKPKVVVTASGKKQLVVNLRHFEGGISNTAVFALRLQFG